MTQPLPVMRDDSDEEDPGLDLVDIAVPILQNLKRLVIGALLVGALAFGITFVIAPTYTAKTVFLPPQQQQSSAASALASLGALAGLTGATAMKSPADQYVALLQSNTVLDKIIDQFQLMAVYEAQVRSDARKRLTGNLRAVVGKKDGLITIEVDDEDPARAASMANQFVAELRQLTAQLALTEAQQRRVFFEGQLKQTRDRLTSAQRALQASGFSQGVLRAEPKAAAEGYARLKAELTAAEVRLQALRSSLSEQTPEVQQQQSAVAALRQQVARAEASLPNEGNGDYLGAYREFKYQETLFELFARQYELARLDESREGAFIQVIDKATPPDRRTKPKRIITTLVATLAAFVVLSAFVCLRSSWRRGLEDPARPGAWQRLRAALRRQPEPAGSRS